MLQIRALSVSFATTPEPLAVTGEVNAALSTERTRAPADVLIKVCRS